jgi:cell division transport system permease protein
MVRDERSRSGASPMQANFQEQLKSYYSHHVQTLVESWQRLWRTPLSTVLTWLAVGIAMALPSGFYVVLSNAEAFTDGWQDAAEMSLYLHDVASEQQGQALAKELASRPEIKSTNYLSRDSALEEFKALSGLAEVTETLRENPLPAVIGIVLADQPDMPAYSQQLVGEMQKHKLVESAQLDMEWLQKLHFIMQLGERFISGLALMLGLGVILVVANTIRLTIESRRDEIRVIKLVGGTDAYVRRPFMYYGLLFGFGGGVVSLLILLGVFFWLAPPLAALFELYSAEGVSFGLGLVDTVLVLLLSTLLGVAGAWSAVSRHLKHIEPN